jgi:YidC/Oxa1 family membrane protein insertase
MIRASSTLRRGLQRPGWTTRVPVQSSGVGFSMDEEKDQSRQNATFSPPQLAFGYVGNNPSQRRFMSSDASPSDDKNFDETMDNLFHDAQREATTEGDSWFLDAATSDAIWEPAWWNLADQAVRAVHVVHDYSGLPYAASIFATTCCIRLVILPVAIKAQRAASRMAHLQPELQLIKKRYEALGTPTQAEQKAFADQMKGIFQRYEVSPFQTLAAPLMQAPLFIGMFFGMKKMPDLFPEEMATGGLYWFTNLTIPDPTYILPIACGISFLATIESGKEQMIDGNPQYGPVIVNAFRGMCFVMVPVMTTFPAAMLCYWVPNNFVTFVQSMTLRNSWVKKQLGIWDRPKPVPGAPDAGFQETMSNLVKKVQGEPTTDKEKIVKHNDEIETKRKVSQMSKATRARRRKK